jgi:hypothetical protein
LQETKDVTETKMDFEEKRRKKKRWKKLHFPFENHKGKRDLGWHKVQWRFYIPLKTEIFFSKLAFAK